MGYSEQRPQQYSTATTWSELVQQGGGLEAKMEDSTTATTMITGVEAEHDDTTTIRSFDSITGRGLLGDFHLDDMDDDDDDQLPVALSTIHTTAETCSVSTAPTDDVSSFGEWANLPPHPSSSVQQQQQLRQPPQFHHRRVPSWEASPHSQYSSQQQQQQHTTSPAALHLPPSFSPQTAWGHQPTSQQNVASFRHDQGGGYRSHPGTPPRYRGAASSGDPNLPYLPRPTQLESNSASSNSPRAKYQQQPQPQHHHHHHPQQQQQYPYHLQQRRPFGLPPNPTPPRAQRTAPSNTGNNNNLVTSGARSSSEVLKTLLRKKACLYESDTSRAVALVTWLVGRRLALHYGFFSRQQLQAGVHACVASKIDAGWITRTKVNRCMQIILNACFHYIIPRPDGSEESGERMRRVFAKEMRNDGELLVLLPPPWNDITAMDRDPVRPSSSPLETPQSSPKIGSVQSPGGKESVDGDTPSDSKRAVLLCFNENVRSAEDVFRCHNEFIRDTAHACHLQLSSSEWRLFFGREAASAPRLWGNIGIPVPTLEDQPDAHVDALGMMTAEEVGCLRTTWCSKRYDHDHELCGFAHPEVNGGWLRRNPSKYNYEGTMCPHVIAVRTDYGEGPKKMIINQCPQGRNCGFCHSMEETVYHPRRYKQHTCSCMQRHTSCPLGEICPDFHPAEQYRFPRKSEGRSPRRNNHQASTTNKAAGTAGAPCHLPRASPILYARPAPTSSFESHLLLPGLKSLFRRNSAVVQSIVQKKSHLPLYSSTDDTVGPQPSRAKSHVIIQKNNNAATAAVGGQQAQRL